LWNKAWNVTAESREKVKFASDLIYTGLFNLGISPPLYILAQKLAGEEIEPMKIAIGAGCAGNGKSLRSSLRNKDGVSSWWFHKVSIKDCESDQTFKFITEILIIIQAAESIDAKEIDEVILIPCLSVRQKVNKFF